jgi:hypothetical protein
MVFRGNHVHRIEQIVSAESDRMKRILQIISWLSLAGTILPSILYLTDWITFDKSILWLDLATVCWFIATPLWMGRQNVVEEVII